MDPSRIRRRLLITYNETDLSRSDSDLDKLSEVAVRDEVELISKTTSRLGYTAECLPLFDFKEAIKAIDAFNPDVIFNLCEGFQGKAGHEMHIAGLWELMGIPYTGNSALTLGLAQNKVLTKKLLESKKILTPAYQLFKTTHQNVYLPFPLFVKPSQEDASLGITQKSIVYNLVSLKKQVNALLKKYNQFVLVERFIPGREFNISILDCPDPKVLAISEIDFSKLDKEYESVVSYESKWIENHPLFRQTPAVCPAQIEPVLKNHLEDIALQVYKILGCRDYARIDVRMDPQGHVYVLECNPNPDISEEAGFSRAVRAAGLSYSDFVETVLNQTMQRKLNDTHKRNAKRRP
jgi:D-alanine-D-alanine ligase